MQARTVCLLALCALTLGLSNVEAMRPVTSSQISTAASPVQAKDAPALDKKKHKKHKKHKKKHEFKSPVGYFIQERASKQLPGPGQHFQFGALKSWETILQTVKDTPDTKLLLLIRHGQAVSNWLQEQLGPDVWFDVEQTCSYKDKNDTVWGVFDAELTQQGEEQGRYLNSILAGGGWFPRITGGLPTRAVVSPLSRCLHTALLVGKDLDIPVYSVEEAARETLGEDTCDARRSVHDPDSKGDLEGPCSYEQGLRTKFPEFDFPILNASKGAAAPGFGLISDADTLWTDERETQKQQIKRAKGFLHTLFDSAPEQVVVVITHSGFTRSILLAMQREPYRPQNTELVPAIVTRVNHGKRPSDSDSDDFEVGEGEDEDDMAEEETL
ncbi:histidine phosphatase superfamily [Haematococcus lacustris]